MIVGGRVDGAQNESGARPFDLAPLPLVRWFLSKDCIFGLLERPLHRAFGPTPGFAIRLLWTPSTGFRPPTRCNDDVLRSSPPISPTDQAQPVRPFPRVPGRLAASRRGSRASPR